MMPSVFQRVRVGPYEIVEEIGRGGMAVVFLATDSRTNRRVALKLVPTGNDREAREILDAERWGAKLQEQFCRACRHVPAVYEHDTDEPYFYIAMEYLEGRNLSEVITDGPLRPERAVAIAIRLCRFLEAAHGFEATIDGRQLRSLLHGDLKPRNIRVLWGDQIKVLDFGIAKALSLSRKVTRNDFGSVAYLSPERLESGDIDAHADFWAVGVLLYEMVGGCQPFRAPDTRRLEQRIRSRRPAASLDGACSPGLRAVVAKLLAGHAADRYSSAKAIREDLECVQSGRPTEAEREGWPGTAPDEPPTQRTHPSAESEEEATRRTSQPGMAQQTASSFSDAGDAGAPQTRRAPARIASAGKRLMRTALLLMALGIIANEVWIAALAERRAATVPTQELENLDETWRQYDLLRGRSSLRFAVIGLERALAKQTAIAADSVIGNYRTPLPIVREGQWRMAREALVHAVRVRPGDTQLKASLRYCDGHLHRINGEARKKERKTAEAQREFTDAVTAFREAAELRPNWPDPFLGLSRTFIYGLEDVDRGADALKQAQRFGYTPGDRETAQLADGYRSRAETLARTARTLYGMTQEQDYLARAAEAYRQALGLYANVPGFAGVARTMRVARHGLAQVEQRIADLSRPVVQPSVPQDRSSMAPESGNTIPALPHDRASGTPRNLFRAFPEFRVLRGVSLQ